MDPQVMVIIGVAVAALVVVAIVILFLTRRTATPSSVAAGPAGEASAPASEAPAPTSEAPAPTSEAPAPRNPEGQAEDLSVVASPVSEAAAPASAAGQAEEWDGLRIEATRAGAAILSASGAVIMAADAIDFAMANPPVWQASSQEMLRTLDGPLSSLEGLVYSTAIYTTTDIRDRLRDVVQRGRYIERVDPRRVHEYVADLKLLNDDVAELFGTTYLPAALTPKGKSPT